MRTRHLPIAALAALLALPPSVSADPPPWAPAHGWRAKHDGDRGNDCAKPRKKHHKKQKHHANECGSRSARNDDPGRYERDTRALGIPQGSCNRDVAGGLLGAAAGGYLGSQVGKGDGQLAATAAGTVIGYIIGSSIGRSMDEVDQACVGQALERARERQTVAWTDRDSRYELTPTRTFRDDGRYCRDYVMDAIVGGLPGTVTGTACRNPDGSWTRE